MTLQVPRQARVPLPLDRIERFCQKWRIEELSLFGSVLREDFSSESDIDVLVTLSPDSHLSLLDFVEMKEERVRVAPQGRPELARPFRAGWTGPPKHPKPRQGRKVICHRELLPPLAGLGGLGEPVYPALKGRANSGRPCGAALILRHLFRIPDLCGS